MLPEQLERLRCLDRKNSWTIEELNELGLLYKLFYRTFDVLVKKFVS
jgi:hypothetical protein